MELIREIIVPTTNSYLLNLPDKLIGKQVEIMLAFENEIPDSDIEIKRSDKIAHIQQIFKDNLIDLSSFKFDRNEANDYES
jgi:hypothetical protein